jgi:hypothetical protein
MQHAPLVWFDYGGRSLLVSDFGYQAWVTLNAAQYECNLCCQTRNTRRATIEADSARGDHVTLFVCDDCVATALERYPDDMEFPPGGKILKAVIRDMKERGL